MLHPSVVKQKGMDQGHVAGHTGHFMEVVKRFLKNLVKEIDMLDAFRMTGENPGRLLMRAERKYRTTTAWRDV